MVDADFWVQCGRKKIPVKFADLPKEELGACEPPNTKNRRILIQKGLSEEVFRSTLVHEVVHWTCDFIDERWVVMLEGWIMAAINCSTGENDGM